MNIPTAIPPERKREIGPASVLTPMQEVEAWSWYCAKRFLGSKKTKAAQMGISEQALLSAIRHMLRRERNQVDHGQR